MSGGGAIQGNSLMAQRIRDLDWGATSLGPIGQWPECLLSMVNLILAAPVAMQLFWGPEMVTIYNDALVPSIAGKHPEALGRPGREVYAEAWEAVGEQLEDVLYRGKSTSLQNMQIPLLRNGVLEETHWTYSYSPVFGPDGTVVGILDVAQDVTEEAKAKAAGELVQERLNLTMESADLGMWSYDATRGVVVLDDRARRIFGSTSTEGPPEYWLNLLHPEDGERIGTHFAGALAGEHPYDIEYRIMRPDGQRWVRSKGRLFGTPGEQQHLFAILEDITSRKLVEESLHQSQTALLQTEKLAAVGRLAASIAHEINNPLESVTNLLFLIGRSDEVSEIQEFAATAERELRRVSIIANQTLRFHRQSTKPVPVFCSDLIGETLSVYQGRLLNRGIEVEKRKRATSPVRCFDGEIRQVLSNLIGNAIDAMPSGGRLVMRSREATNWKTGERGLVLTVADTGIGMSASVRKRMFEAFYTTKGIGGTGLGLWISGEIVSRHGGSLRVRSSQSEGGSGTVFTLFLPFEAEVVAPARGEWSEASGLRS